MSPNKEDIRLQQKHKKERVFFLSIFGFICVFVLHFVCEKNVYFGVVTMWLLSKQNPSVS